MVNKLIGTPRQWALTDIETLKKSEISYLKTKKKKKKTHIIDS